MSNPNPSHYRSVTAYRLAQAEHAAAHEFTRNLRRLAIAVCLLVAEVLAVVRWPGIALACILVFGCLTALIGGIWLTRPSGSAPATSVQKRRQAVKDSFNPWGHP